MTPDRFSRVPRLDFCETKNECSIIKSNQNRSCSRCPARHAAPFVVRVFVFVVGEGVHSDPHPLVCTQSIPVAPQSIPMARNAFQWPAIHSNGPQPFTYVDMGVRSTGKTELIS